MPEAPAPFLFGIEGRRPTRKTLSLLRDTRAAGILLLARNIGTAEQTRRLVMELRDRLGRDLLVSVDHEGGWVMRFSGLLTAFPGNAALSRCGRPRLARKASRTMARELKALGIGLNLAPVADVQGERYNPGIGIRSFGSDPKIVSKYSKEFICGHFDHNIASCIKHFPGKGDADVDAHISRPTIRASRSRMTRVHLAPFRAAIAAGVPCVMTTHAAYPALDPARRTATDSPLIAQKLLRRRMGFKGVLISDDLGMGAVVKHEKVPGAAVRSLKAGHDLLIVAQNPDIQRKSAAAIERALTRGEIEPTAWKASRGRLKRLMDRFARPPSGRILRPDTALPKRIAAGAVEILQTGKVRVPLVLTGKPEIDVYWPDLRELEAAFAFEGGPTGPRELVRRHLSHWPARFKFHIMPVQRRFAGGTSRKARRGGLALFFCFDARRYPAQREALKRVQREADRLVVILMKNPWDRTMLEPNATALTAYGFRNCQLQALLERLR